MFFLRLRHKQHRELFSLPCPSEALCKRGKPKEIEEVWGCRLFFGVCYHHSMRVMGIDPGVGLTGWAVVEKTDPPQLVEYGCIETKAGLSQEQRLMQIFDQLGVLIEQYAPEVCCLEKLFFNSNAKTALNVGEARGVMKVCILQHRLPLEEFTPLQVKSALTGYGRADKNQIQQMVKTLLKLDKIPQPDDAADAVAVALTYCFYKPELR